MAKLAKLNVGDKVRVISNISGSNNRVGDVGVIVEVDLTDDTYRVQVQGRSDFGNWTLKDDLKLLVSKKPTKNERIAALEAKVEALEERMAMYEDVVVEHADKTVNVFLGGDGLSTDGALKITSKPTLDELIAQCSGRTNPHLQTPNQRRADTIKRAKEYVRKLEKHGVTLEESSEGNATHQFRFYTVEYHVNNKKRAVTALVFEANGRGDKLCELIEKATAKCSPDDVFNADIGKAIALSRALGLECPREFTHAVQPSEVVVGMVVMAAESSGYDRTPYIAHKVADGRVYDKPGEGFITEGVALILEDTDAAYDA